jgi:hypothetical protein
MTYIFVIIRKVINIILVPDKYLGNCPDPELNGTGLGGSAVRGAGQATTGPGRPNIWEGSSTDLARMEETWKEIPPPGSRCDTAESAANRVRALHAHI